MMNLSGVQVSHSAESSRNEEVLRNVKVILSTLEGTVPYDREFGVDVEILDLPINEAKSLYTVECVVKVRKYEPRASVLTVDFSHDAIKGVIYPKVVIQIETERTSGY